MAVKRAPEPPVLELVPPELALPVRLRPQMEPLLRLQAQRQVRLPLRLAQVVMYAYMAQQNKRLRLWLTLRLDLH